MFGTTLCALAFTGFTLLSGVEAFPTDPNGECGVYSYPPVASAIAAGQFPPIWTPADIMPNDAAGNAKFKQISGTIPNIAQKGTNITGNFTAFTPTYSPTDTDCWWSYSKCTTPKLAGLVPDLINTPEPNSLGYGFDDGPNCSHNAFYDYLTSQNQKATMFYIGSNVLDWPYEAQRAIDDGHEICAHTWSHRYITAMNNSAAFAELWYSIQAIKLVTGYTVTCWRPPYGDVDDRIRFIANALGLKTIVWTYDSNDWKAGQGNITAATVDSDYQALISAQQAGTFNTAGTMILTHELNNFTMSEAVKWYPALKAAFAAIVPIGVAYNVTHPYVETNYTLPSFADYMSGKTVATNVTTGQSGKNGDMKSYTATFSSVYALLLVGAMLVLA